MCAKVRARAPQNEKKRTFGGPRVPKGGKMEPKLRKISTQNVQKNKVSQKSAKCGLDLLFTIYKPHRDLPKTSPFYLLGRLKTGPAPRAASHATPMLRNGGQGAEKCPEWVPLGGQRTANGLQMSPKCLQKIVKNRPPVPEYAPRAPKVPPSLPKAQFLIKIR